MLDDRARGRGPPNSRISSDDACRIVSRYSGGLDAGDCTDTGRGDVARRARVRGVGECERSVREGAAFFSTREVADAEALDRVLCKTSPRSCSLSLVRSAVELARARELLVGAACEGIDGFELPVGVTLPDVATGVGEVVLLSDGRRLSGLSGPRLPLELPLKLAPPDEEVELNAFAVGEAGEPIFGLIGR